MLFRSVLTTIALFNPNKEVAFVCEDGKWSKWNPDKKMLEQAENPLSHAVLLRRDEPDIGAQELGKGSPSTGSTSSRQAGSGEAETGICYSIAEASDADLESSALQEIFGNPHASTLEKMV